MRQAEPYAEGGDETCAEDFLHSCLAYVTVAYPQQCGGQVNQRQPLPQVAGRPAVRLRPMDATPQPTICAGFAVGEG